MWLPVASACLLLTACSHARSLTTRDDTFDWNNLSASTNISWTPCFVEFQCARLTVPLQYSNPNAGEAQIAILMSPSNFSRNDTRYRGPVLFNNGGPGGSGVLYVMQMVQSFRKIVGPQYDLVGFDPRGVGNTTPPLSVFGSPVEAYELYSTYPGNLNESVSSFGRMYAQAQILGDLAKSRAQNVAESVSTAAVASDMLSITRAFGFEEVNYWGISYGSVLGAAFAAMYPNHVGRFIIDGVFNSHEWFASGSWATSFINTDDVLTAYYDACVAAGPSLCAIWENSTDLVRARVDRLIDKLRLEPLPSLDTTSPNNSVFTVIDDTALRTQIRGLLYEPYTFGELAASALVLLEQGQGAQFFAVDPEVAVTQEMFATCAFDTSRPYSDGYLDVVSAIACGDVLSTALPTIDEARAEYENARNISTFADELWPFQTGACAGWSLRGKDRFNGSFTTNTSSPILLIGNTFDPATPLVSARNMSAGFANSVLLQQNSIGHTSQTASSICTESAINAYFANGTLPAPGTICQVESQIFGGVVNGSSASGGAGPLRRRRLPAELY